MLPKLKLVTCGGAADAEDTVYHFAQKSVEFGQHEIYSAKSGDFLIFYCYICNVIQFFAAFELHH